MKNYSIDIFLKTYRNDFKLLKYALMSIDKFATGYDNVILMVPVSDYDLFKQYFQLKDLSDKVLVVLVDEPEGRGYMFQQACKMNACKYSDADYIFYMDSDCIIDKPLDMQSIVVDGRPEILMSSYFNDEGVGQLGGALCWQYPTQLFFNRKVDAEYMRRNFLVYHRSTLVEINDYSKTVHGYSIGDYIMRQDRISEFNIIGAYAHFFEKDKYIFTDTNKGWQFEDAYGVQLWSHADENDQSETHQFEYKRSLNYINSIFGLNLTEI